MFYEDYIVTYADKFQMVLDSWSSWNLEISIFAERELRKPGELELLKQGRKSTNNSTHI
jgi:hypothetical protein